MLIDDIYPGYRMYVIPVYGGDEPVWSIWQSFVIILATRKYIMKTFQYD
jgi:hypothetical protein